MRNIRRTLRALLEQASFYSTKSTHKIHFRDSIKKSADQAYQYLTTESAHKKKMGFIARLMFTCIFFLTGVYLVFNSMTHVDAQTSTSRININSTQSTTPSTGSASAKGRPSMTYTPGKGGNNAQANVQNVNDLPACDPNKSMIDQIGSGNSETTCVLNGQNNGITYTCTFDQLGVSQTDDSLTANCYINQVQYACYINDWQKSLNDQKIQCNGYTNGNDQNCQLSPTTATCQLENTNGEIECTIQPDKSITGIPAPASNVPIPNATVCPIAIPTCSATTSTALPTWLTGQNGLLNSTSSDTLDTTVGSLWTSMRDIALALLVIPFALAGYQIMLGASSSRYAGSIQILTRVLIASAAVISSLYLIEMTVNIENVIAQTITSVVKFNPPANANPIVTDVAQWSCYTHQFFGSIFNISIYSMQQANKNISTNQYVQLNYIDTETIANNLPYYITTLLSIMLAIQLTVRFALICFQAVLSPLVFMCGALPGDMGQMVIRPWMRGFVSLLIVQFLQLLVILAGYTLFGGLTATSWGDDWVTTLFQTLTPMIIIIVTLNIPRMMGSATTNIISQVSSSFSSASTGILLIIRGL